ncbi:MAG: hypothetical protein ACT4QC_10280 [Planctomycetaceae bacterium]
MNGIDLKFLRHEALPRLAWCARLQREQAVATVWHGPWVETARASFVEGIWDGPFADSGFPEASMFTGSGGRATRDGIEFCASTHLVDRLFSLHADDALFVSNSLVFLLVAAGDRPQPDYPFYFHDLASQRWLGITSQVKRIRTESGRWVRLHDGENFLIRPDLSITRLEKRSCPPPRNFGEYRRLLDETLRTLFDNAAAPARIYRYDPVTTLSRGYDATAISVLAHAHGCRRAITFRDRLAERPDLDNGLEIGRRLGLETSVYERFGFRELPGTPEAEFLVIPNGMDRLMAVAELDLPGTLLLTGRHGDLVWTLARSRIMPDYQLPYGRAIPELSMIEFRLRVGFLRLPVPYIAGRDSGALYQISTAPEMAPWSIGGSYDRPIPRRIAEEGGIPRDWFGQQKLASAFTTDESTHWSAAGYADYLQFVQSTIPELRGRYRWPLKVLPKVSRAFERARPHAERLLKAGRVRASWPNLVPARYRHELRALTYAMQYGFARTRFRYSEVAAP